MTPPALSRRAGSSPLTRGKWAAQRRLFRSAGLIPAHAGKIRVAIWRAIPARAHPRSRGENISGLFIDAAAKGSSPLTRGKSAIPDDVRDRAGLIPAHAGKISECASSVSPSRAHPRSRGENVLPVREECLHRGSSPLTRGKCLFRLGSNHRRRLIPAHAGKIQREFRRAQTA